MNILFYYGFFVAVVNSHWYLTVKMDAHSEMLSFQFFFNCGSFRSITHKPPTSYWGIVKISGIPFTGKGELGLLNLFLLSCGFMILRDQLSPICLATEAICHCCHPSYCCRRKGWTVWLLLQNTCSNVNWKVQQQQETPHAKLFLDMFFSWNLCIFLVVTLCV